MVDGLSLCSCACVTCLWCSLLAICFPKLFKKLQETDSSVFCTVDSNKGKKNIERCKNDGKILSIDEQTCRLNKPKCTIKIIRKTKARKKSDDKFYDDDDLAIDSGVQTDFCQRRRSPRIIQGQTEGYTRRELNERVNRRGNSCYSDQSLNFGIERTGGRDYGQRDQTENGVKKSKDQPARYRNQIIYDCDDNLQRRREF